MFQMTYRKYLTVITLLFFNITRKVLTTPKHKL
jgi:hypothetical protein